MAKLTKKVSDNIDIVGKSSSQPLFLVTSGEQRNLPVVPDLPDFRDYAYTPTLARTPVNKQPKSFKSLPVLNQLESLACTGFALATCINGLTRERSKHKGVSARMLYEMALKFDRWAGVKEEGSSCRGAIKGWYSMGVCSDKQWPFTPDRGIVTVDRAKQARKTRIGAYYRLNHRLADFHSALNETGVLYVSANVHSGWNLDFTETNQPLPLIKSRPSLERANPSMGHAFCLVGYNKEGFIVQNSYGQNWGRAGFAVWSYEDWYENIWDAWVFQLSLSTPAIWQVSTRYKQRLTGVPGAQSSSAKPVRSEIAGHFVHIDDGEFHDHGSFWSDLDDVKETANNLQNNMDDPSDDKNQYQDLLLYAHGGLNTPNDSAMRVMQMKEIFKVNGVYPYHFMYDTGIIEEVKDILLNKLVRSSGRAGSLSDISDRALELLLRNLGRAIWREMKNGARKPFEEQNAGIEVLKSMLPLVGEGKNKLRLHLVGHSTGGILIAYLVSSIRVLFPKMQIASVSLMAPATTVNLFKQHYLPLLDQANETSIEDMAVYNLTDKLERDDKLLNIYNKSLLYLVSRSFEEQLTGHTDSEDLEKDTFGERLLGMQRYSSPLDQVIGKKVGFIYAGRDQDKQASCATTHGGFDNDPVTLNHILKRILNGRNPTRLFEKSDLDH